MQGTHLVRRTLEALQSSQAMRFLWRYARPRAESIATCLPLQRAASHALQHPTKTVKISREKNMPSSINNCHILIQQPIF